VSTAPNETTFHARKSRRGAIEAFFLDHVGERFGTAMLHGWFGTSFRARASEINRSPSSAIRILNKTGLGNDATGQPLENSVYWAELRSGSTSTGEARESDYMRRVREDQAQGLPLFAGMVRK
jgi:hypothetical protein